jgi:hypothetical protein
MRNRVLVPAALLYHLVTSPRSDKGRLGGDGGGGGVWGWGGVLGRFGGGTNVWATSVMSDPDKHQAPASPAQPPLVATRGGAFQKNPLIFYSPIIGY